MLASVEIGSHVEQVKKWNPAQSNLDTSFTYIDLSSVDKERKKIDLSLTQVVSCFKAPSRARQLVKASDILVATVRPNLNGVAQVPFQLNDATASTGYCVLRANNKSLNSKYLFYWVQTKSFIGDMMSKSTGANYPAVSDKLIKQGKIPLPPLAEQQKIAAILDAADVLRQKDQQLIDHYTTLSQSLFLDMFGDPVTNPMGWDFFPLSEFVTKLGDGLHGTPAYNENGDYYFINGNNLHNGKIQFNSTTKKVSRLEFNKHKKTLNKSTMLVSINGTIGKVAFYNNEKIVLGKSACYFNIKETLISKMSLFHLVESPYFIRYASGMATGSTIKNVSLKTMREFPIPLPPITLQNQFADRIALIEKQKQQAQASLEQSNNLFNSLLQKAFTGELTA